MTEGYDSNRALITRTISEQPSPDIIPTTKENPLDILRQSILENAQENSIPAKQISINT